MHESASARKTMPSPSAAAPDRRAFAGMVAGSALLAFGPWLVRHADVGPIAAGFWRLAIAIPFLAVAMIRTRQVPARQPIAIWVALAAAGLFFAADLGSWHVGILRTKLANATLFGNVGSFLFAIYGLVVARTPPGRSQKIALALAAAGVLLLLGRSYELSSRYLIGDLLCLLAGVFYTGYLVIVDRVRGTLTSWPVLLVATVAGAPALLAVAALAGEAIWPHDWTPVVLLSLSSQVVGQGLVVWAIGRLSPLVVGLVLLLQPLISAAIGWLAYGERLGPLDAVGALAIAAALVLVRRGDP